MDWLRDALFGKSLFECRGPHCDINIMPKEIEIFSFDIHYLFH